MYLYSVTLSQATAINQVVYGSFTKAHTHEVAVAKGKILEVYRPDDTTNKLKLVYSQEIFGLIRQIAPFRLMGMNKDFLVVGSDSGRIVILEFDTERNQFIKIHQETFGKTGARRIVPGEFLATDPKGRAIMIGACEKQKFVYILNRDTQNKLTISSPLEAFKPHVLTLAMVGVDVGIENPQFACLEIDYGDAEQNFSAVNTGNAQKTLTFYEMDLGLNHVIRKNILPLDSTAHMLIQVPGDEGPAGILVVCEDFLVYKRPDHEERKCYFPQRYDQNRERGLFISSHSTFSHGQFFFILQSEFGDLYKVTLECADNQVHSIVIQYFDTLPPSTCINILKTGFLFMASEASNHGLYLFKSTGEDEENAVLCTSQQAKQHEESKLDSLPRFNPREQQNNLEVMDEMQNFAPINDMKVEDLTGEGSPQIYMASGRGAHGTIRSLRHGLSVVEMAVSPMPGRPLTVTTLKGNLKDEHHKFMIVSFPESTLVLQIAQDKVSQVADSGFQTNEPTLHTSLLEGDVLIQVTQKCLVQIKGHGESRKRTKWESEKGRILMACSNTRQVIVFIEGGQLVYFELDELNGLLNESQTKFFTTDVKCLDVGEVPEGRQRCKFLVVGFADKSVKILSLEPESCLHRISTQALPAVAESVSLMTLGGGKDEDGAPGVGSLVSSQEQLYLHVGLDNGVLLRSLVDNVTGQLTDSRQQFLGTRAIQLTKVKQNGQDAMIALSNKPWLCYSYMGRYRVTPLSYESLSNASPFSSERCPEGVVAIAENTLRIISVERLGEQFTQQVLATRYTPCKIQVHPETNNLVVLEKDHRCYSWKQLEDIKQKVYEETKDESYLNADWAKLGSYPRANVNQFASCVRIVDPYTMESLSVLEFENNETCFSIYVSQNPIGHNTHEGIYLFCGVGLEAKLSPRSCSLGFIKTYKFVNGGKSLELLHSTPCEDIPSAFNEYRGRLVSGIGHILRIYELGMKKLLRKQENKNFASPVISIKVEESGRIFAADVSESIHVLKYKPEDAQLYIFADDVLKRWTTSFCLLDHDTVAGIDKFENLYINRLPTGCEDDAEDDPTASKFKWENGYLNGAAHKMDGIAQYYMGEMGTQIVKQTLSPQTGQEMVLVSTSMGSITAFIPFESREDIDFFSHLEMYLRIEAQPLCGRDHVMFRSIYAPCKDVIDGDLCELYGTLDFNTQRILAEELDRTPPEVQKKLEQIRQQIL